MGSKKGVIKTKEGVQTGGRLLYSGTIEVPTDGTTYAFNGQTGMEDLQDGDLVTFDTEEDPNTGHIVAINIAQTTVVSATGTLTTREPSDIGDGYKGQVADADGNEYNYLDEPTGDIELGSDITFTIEEDYSKDPHLVLASSIRQA